LPRAAVYFWNNKSSFILYSLSYSIISCSCMGSHCWHRQRNLVMSSICLNQILNKLC